MLGLHGCYIRFVLKREEVLAFRFKTENIKQKFDAKRGVYRGQGFVQNADFALLTWIKNQYHLVKTVESDYPGLDILIYSHLTAYSCELMAFSVFCDNHLFRNADVDGDDHLTETEFDAIFDHWDINGIKLFYYALLRLKNQIMFK